MVEWFLIQTFLLLNFLLSEDSVNINDAFVMVKKNQIQVVHQSQHLDCEHKPYVDHWN